MRAFFVLVLFVVVTVLVLSEIHPSGSRSTTAAPPTTTATTRPTHPTTTTTTIPPSKVPVVVANASGVSGAAAAVTSELQPGGWDLQAPTNASAQVTVSHVYYLAGFARQAASIASTLQLPATSIGPYTTSAPISSIGTADVAVVVGPELADRATNPSTTTTAG